jgi:hypothetical protein
MWHSFKYFFKSYYMYTVRLLNLFKTTLYTTCFDRHWSSSDVLKLLVETAVLAFCTSSVRCVVQSHICVFSSCWVFAPAALCGCVFKPHNAAGRNTQHYEKLFSMWSIPRGYIMRTPTELQSVVRESVKWRQGGWCEVAASLVVS